MTKSPMAMMGSKLNFQYLTKQRKGKGTQYRWTGTMMWMKMDFTVQVTNRVEAKEKTWETIGKADMIIYSWYRVHLSLTPTDDGGTKSEMSIAYTKPDKLWYKFLTFLFADMYCWWCLKNIMQDTGKTLNAKHAHGSYTYKPR